jgi:arylsulfatase A-like enzyme
LGDYKLHEYFENNTVQLFNLKEDVGEQNNLAKSEPKKAAELLALLRDWRQEVSARMMGAKDSSGK